jgi:hypothetical protein
MKILPTDQGELRLTYPLVLQGRDYVAPRDGANVRLASSDEGTLMFPETKLQGVELAVSGCRETIFCDDVAGLSAVGFTARPTVVIHLAVIDVRGGAVFGPSPGRRAAGARSHRLGRYREL